MALVALAAFTACEDDRDSNPVLNTSGNVTFELNAPEFASLDVVLGSTQSLPLTWSQPMLTTDNAPLGAAGTYGLVYEVQASKDGNFTKTFDAALEEVTDEEGNFTGTPSGHDYSVLNAEIEGCKAELSAEELNKVLNQLYLWADASSMSTSELVLRVLAYWSKGDGTRQVLATSNLQTVRLVPSAWIDVMKVPAKESYLWIPGNGNGWNHGVAPVLVSTDGEIYTGYAYMNGEFKFTPVGDWSAEYNNSSFTTVSDNIDLGDGGGGNINFSGESGMYFFTVNPGEGSLTATPVTWSIIGGFNNWGGDEFMTYDEGEHCLTCTVTFDTDTEWKFRRDSGWDYNFGGSLDALEQDGSNFSATAGTHTIKLFIERPAQDGLHATMD